MDQRSYYQNLIKPSWTPNESVFGQVWGVLYPIIILINIYVVYLLLESKISWVIALPFWLNLFFNIIYTPIQFGLRNNWLASIDILLVLGTIIWAMIAIWPYSRLLTAAMVPYLIWVTIATVLQISITWLNK